MRNQIRWCKVHAAEGSRWVQAMYLGDILFLLGAASWGTARASGTTKTSFQVSVFSKLVSEATLYYLYRWCRAEKILQHSMLLNIPPPPPFSIFVAPPGSNFIPECLPPPFGGVNSTIIFMSLVSGNSTRKLWSIHEVQRWWKFGKEPENGSPVRFRVAAGVRLSLWGYNDLSFQVSLSYALVVLCNVGLISHI